MGLPRGELFGLLGANGAGKTTAIAMVMRALYPNAGGIEIEGHSVLTNFKMASKKLGVVTQHNTLWDKLSGLDHLRLFARLRGVEATKVEGLVRATVAQMELGPYAERLAGQLSGGMKRKLVRLRERLYIEGRELMLLEEVTTMACVSTPAGLRHWRTFAYAYRGCQCVHYFNSLVFRFLDFSAWPWRLLAILTWCCSTSPRRVLIQCPGATCGTP